MSLTVSAVDPANQAAVVEWNELIRCGFDEGREAAPWRSSEATIAQFTSPRPGRTSVALLALVDGEPVGGADATAAEGRPLDLEVSVPVPFRRRGIGRALVTAVRATLPEATIARSSVFSDAGIAFAQAMGLSVGMQHARQLLGRPVEPGTIDALEREVPGLEVRSWAGRCPDDVVTDMVTLVQQMREDAPTGGLTPPAGGTDVAAYRENEEWADAAGLMLLTCLALFDGRPAGHTEMHVNTHEPVIAQHSDTLVERSLRGRGVGRALKVANLRRLRECPQAAGVRRLQSHTALDNEPMLSLNRVMGVHVADVMTVLEGPLREA